MQQYKQSEDEQFKDVGALLPFLKRIFSYAMSYKSMFRGFIISVVLVAISDAIFPTIWMFFLDDAITPLVEIYQKSWAEGITPEPDWSGLWLYGGLFLANGIFQVICVYYFIKFAGYIQESVMYDLRKEMFQKLQNLSFSYYDKSASGWLLSRITSDTERVVELISWGFLECIWGVTMITICLSIMFFFNWQLTLIVLIAIPVLVVISVKIRMLILKYSRQARKINSELTASFTEHNNGVQVNKITAQEERVSGEFRTLSNKMRKSSFMAQYYTAMYLPLVIFIGSAAAGMVLFFGGKMALAVPAGITIGTLAAFFSYATQIFIPILDIARFYALAQGSLSAGERIFSLIDEEVTIKDQEGASDFEEIKGQIEFENTRFEYVEGKVVLPNFNLKIEAGKSIALVGATGAGKTTVINLVCRFYEPTSGVLKIDGEDYLTKSLQSLRSQLGIVLQTPHLFSGTVRDNVKFGRQESTDEDIIAALRLLGAEDFVKRLEEEVGEGGEKLSMGERQLISFARAVLTDPRILIMDEATSSIDTLTEARIQASIEQMIQGRTALIIAHRLSTIKNCDRILVMRQGEIIEDGNHQELMRLKGHYYGLYTKQLEKESLVKEEVVSE
ncbi:MAG: ABC transporter ATP-binding protein [Chitinophagales bacterium]